MKFKDERPSFRRRERERGWERDKKKDWTNEKEREIQRKEIRRERGGGGKKDTTISQDRKTKRHGEVQTD